MCVRIVIKGDPRTKKNSQRAVWAGGKYRQIPSKAYQQYLNLAMVQIPLEARAQLNGPVNVKCVYYMKIDYAHARAKIDLVNLLEATCDILVDTGVLLDDNSRVIISHDGSRVKHDPHDPRVEIEITEAKDGI